MKVTSGNMVVHKVQDFIHNPGFLCDLSKKSDLFSSLMWNKLVGEAAA